jgi:hypothetical protein
MLKHQLTAVISLFIIQNACKSITPDSQPAAIIGKDDRTALADQRFEGMIGTVLYQTPEYSNIKCTASFVDRNTVVTALHCIDPTNLGPYRIVLKGQKPIALTGVKKAFTEADVVYLTVDFQNSAFLPSGSLDPNLSTQIISYEVARSRLVEDSGTKIKSVGADGLITHELDTVESASGSPLLQNGKIVGIHLGALYDKPLIIDLSSKSEAIDKAFAYIAENKSEEAHKILEPILAGRNAEKAKLIGNVAIDINALNKASIASLRPRMSFESLIGGAADVITANISSFEFAESGFGPRASHFNDAARAMIIEATSVAVQRGYRGEFNHACALRNTSSFSKSTPGDVPGADANLFKFINRPSLGAVKQTILVNIQPLNPTQFPCGATYTAGKAPVGLYSSSMIGDSMHHLFRIAINAACSNTSATETNRWAGTVAHEMLHNLGQQHKGTSTDPATYKGRYVKEFGHCVAYGPNWDLNSLGLTGGFNPYSEID